MLNPEPKETPTLNRAQRKAWEKLQKSAAFKKASPYRQAVELHRNGLGFLIPKDVYKEVSVPNLKPLVLLNDCRPYHETEVAGQLIKIRFAYERLKDGTADKNDFDRVGVAINLAKVRAMEIDETLANALERAQDAMTRCKDRYQRHGRFGFDGPGLQDMEYAIEANEEIVTHSSPKQMDMAMQAMVEALRKQTGYGQQLAAMLL